MLRSVSGIAGKCLFDSIHKAFACFLARLDCLLLAFLHSINRSQLRAPIQILEEPKDSVTSIQIKGSDLLAG